MAEVFYNTHASGCDLLGEVSLQARSEYKRGKKQC